MKTVLLLWSASILPASLAAQQDNAWFGFASYPGAREMCDQVVMGSGNSGPAEIHWRSFATSDAIGKVIAYYEKTKVTDVEKKPDSLTLRLNKDTTLSVDLVSAHYPACDKKPKPGEKTVIVVSRASRR